MPNQRGRVIEMAGVSKATWISKFEKLPAWKQTLIRKMYGVDPQYKKLKDEKRYKDPDTLIRAVANRLKRDGMDEYLKICGRCNGTGEYDLGTITDEYGRRWCFKCNGYGYFLKRLSSKEVDTLYLILNGR